MSMIHQAIEIELGGKKRFIYLGYSSQRRIRQATNRSWEQFYFRDLWSCQQDAEGRWRPIELNPDLFQTGLRLSLHDLDPAAPGKLRYNEISEDEIAEMLDDWHSVGEFYERQLKILTAFSDAGRLVGILPPLPPTPANADAKEADAGKEANLSPNPTPATEVSVAA